MILTMDRWPPSEATIRRLTHQHDRRVIAVDGKTPRGARDAAGNLVLLLAGLLKVLDITDAVVTAEAMHCRRETAQTIRDRGGHYLLTRERQSTEPA